MRPIQRTLCELVMGLTFQFQPLRELPPLEKPFRYRGQIPTRRRFPIPTDVKTQQYKLRPNPGALYERARAQCYSSCGRY